MRDILGYEGKRVIVTGAASGMGAATAAILVDLGVEVHAIDIKKPDVTGLASYTECDLRDPDQIDAAVDRIGKIVNTLFNCAGLPNTSPDLDVMLVNFCGLRHLTEAVAANMIERQCDRVQSLRPRASAGDRTSKRSGRCSHGGLRGRAARGAKRTRRNSPTRYAPVDGGDQRLYGHPVP